MQQLIYDALVIETVIVVIIIITMMISIINQMILYELLNPSSYLLFTERREKLFGILAAKLTIAQLGSMGIKNAVLKILSMTNQFNSMRSIL